MGPQKSYRAVGPTCQLVFMYENFVHTRGSAPCYPDPATVRHSVLTSEATTMMHAEYCSSCIRFYGGLKYRCIVDTVTLNLSHWM